MDWDKEFISAVSKGGLTAYKTAIARGMNPDIHLHEDGKTAWEFIVNYHGKYDEIPSIEVIQEKARVSIVNITDEPIEVYIDEIFERRLGFVCKEGAREIEEALLSKDRKKAADAIAAANRKIQEEQLVEAKVDSLLGMGQAVIDSYLEAKSGKRGIPTPWPTMDEQTLGWWPEDLILFAGRSGAGKSYLLLACAHKAWMNGNKVLIVSTEMSKLQMARRFFAIHLSMSHDLIRKGQLGDFAEPQFFKKVLDLEPDVLVDDRIKIVGGDFDFTIENLTAVVQDEKPELLCVDGPYLIKNKGKDRRERVSNTFDDFKRIGKKYKPAIVTNMQFNREAKTGQKNTVLQENIGVTDVGAWNATAAYGLMQTEEMMSNLEMGLKPLKIRDGIPKEFKIRWNFKAMDFSEVPSDGSGPSVPQAGVSDTSETSEGPADEYDDIPF